MIIDGIRFGSYDEMTVESINGQILIDGVAIEKSLDKKSSLCYNDLVMEDCFI